MNRDLDELRKAVALMRELGVTEWGDIRLGDEPIGDEPASETASDAEGDENWAEPAGNVYNDPYSYTVGGVPSLKRFYEPKPKGT